MICFPGSSLLLKDFFMGFDKSVQETVIMTHLLPCVKELVIDATRHVKSALVSVIMGLVKRKWAKT